MILQIERLTNKFRTQSVRDRDGRWDISAPDAPSAVTTETRARQGRLNGWLPRTQIPYLLAFLLLISLLERV